MSIYQEIILDHYKHPRNSTIIARPTHSIEVDNPLCGDRLTLSVDIKDQHVENIGYTAEGCAISIASASMLSEYAKGKTVTDLRKLDQSFILNMLGIELSPNRLKCALLPLEALHKIIWQ